MLKLLSRTSLFILFITFACISIAETKSELKNSQNDLLNSYFKEESPDIKFNDIVFYNQDKEKRSLENFDNRFIIIHFWATWCMECQNELMALNKLQKDFRKNALVVLALSEDFKDASAIDEYFTKHKIDMLDIYMDKKNAIYKGLNINHIPASYLIDFDGKVLASSLPGKVVDWDDEDLRKFFNSKLENHHLLPPEYKAVRDVFVKPEEAVDKSKTDSTKKNEIIIN